MKDEPVKSQIYFYQSYTLKANKSQTQKKT